MKNQSNLLILAFCSLIIATYGRTAFPDLTDDNFLNEALHAHNAFRAKHKDTPPLVIDQTIVAYSKSRCNTVSQYEQLNEGHAGNQGSGYGENLFWGASSVSSLYNSSAAVKSWYDEISLYSYSSPGFSSATGHFTQLVWKTTTSVGCARCGGRGSQWYETYVTCNYKPPGNYIGQFGTNVMPLCGTSCTTTITNNTTTNNNTTTTNNTTTNTTKNADETSLIESARKSDTYYIAYSKVVNDTDKSIIATIAFDNVDKHDTLKDIEVAIRKDLDTKYGGKWLVIITSSVSNYASNWDSGIDFKYIMEFYTDGLRFFIFQVLSQ